MRIHLEIDIWIYREERQVIEIFHDGIVRVMQKKE